MDRKEHIEWLNSVEERYPVNEWQINNIHIWPLIKIKLSIENSKKSDLSKPPSYLSIANQLLIILQGFISIFKLRVKNKSKLPLNFYCLASHFRYNDGEYNINRYFNQLIAEDKKCKRGFKILDYSTTTTKYRKNIDFYPHTIFLENIKYVALVIRTLKVKKYKDSTQDWKDFGKFLKEVNSTLPKNKLTRNSIIKQYVFIKSLSSIYKLLLKKNRVENVYILCYYVSEMYAMNLAASELGINTWDIQHGGQGKLHAAYSNFNKVSSSGYKLLPKYFWCWDNNSAEEIEKWTRNQSYHDVVVKGNPWIEYVTQYLNTEIDTKKEIILYTLQPIKDNILEPYIIEAISKTPDNFIWWLRLHPRQLEQKQELINLLVNKNVYHKVEIEKAVSFPLPVILNQCFVHVSGYSGAILEAYMLKKVSIILNSIGVEIFPEVVESKYSRVVLNENCRDLLKEITSIKENIPRM